MIPFPYLFMNADSNTTHNQILNENSYLIFLIVIVRLILNDFFMNIDGNSLSYV